MLVCNTTFQRRAGASHVLNLRVTYTYTKMAPKEDTPAKTWQEEIYDSDAGTVFGRDKSSWAKILLFYAVYYSFLFCLFYAFTFKWYEGKQPEPWTGKRPTVGTRLDQPGGSIQPINNFTDGRVSARPLQLTLKTTKAKGSVTYEHYSEVLNAYFDEKDRLNEKANAKDCGAVNSTYTANKFANQQTCKTYERPKTAPEVVADVREKKPIIALELNKIIDWYPRHRGIGAISDDLKSPEYENGVYIDCYQWNAKKAELKKDDTVKIEYLTPRVLKQSMFPFLGRKVDEPHDYEYNKPYVAVQISRSKSWGDEFADFRCDFIADNLSKQSSFAKEYDSAAKKLVDLFVGTVEFGFKFE